MTKVTKTGKQPMLPRDKFITKTFDKHILRELISDDEVELEDGTTLNLISDKITGDGRWSIHHKMIFRHGDLYYSVEYRVGATEYQDERPFEDEDVDVECTEVIPTPKTVVVYEPKKMEEDDVGT